MKIKAQDPQSLVKAALRGNFMSLNAYTRKEKNLKIIT